MSLPDKYERANFVSLFVMRQYGAFLSVDHRLPLAVAADLNSCEFYYQRLVSLAASVFQKGWVCIDIGCGPGRLVGEFARLGAESAVGLDKSAHMVQIAATILRSPESCELKINVPLKRTTPNQFHVRGWGFLNTHFINGDAERTPFGNAAADLVCCANVLSRTANPRQCLAELYRILKPNGFLLLSNDYDWSRQYAEPDKWFDDIRQELPMDSWRIHAVEDGVRYTAWLHGRKAIVAVNELLLVQRL